MTRKIFSFFIAIVILSSCGNQGKKETSSKDGNPDGSLNVQFTALTENPDNYVGKDISIRGKVVHVCMHSGKKMFITGENPDIRLYIQAGEEMPKFPTELLGSEVEVQGKLIKVSSGSEQPGMNSGEGKSASSANADSCATEKALAGQAVLSDLMMIYSKHSVVN